jgi:diguanylate cyclase (GGDEF)-like protein
VKNVAVLIRNIFGDYSAEALRGITDFYKDKGVNVVVFQTRTANDTAGMCEEQYWMNAHLAGSKEIDGVIIISAEYVSATTPDDLADELAHLSSKPVVSMAIKLPLTFDSSYTSTSCEKSYFDVINHLKRVHNCKKIAFFSAGLTKSIEGEERLDAFIKAMKDNHLQLGHIIMGDFTFQNSVKELKRAYKSKSDIDFDALVCANDRMALGAMEVLKGYGVKIPEEVKVIGFDNSESARTYSPALASIDQDVYGQGRVCAELLLDKLNDKEVAKNVKISLKPVFNESCGCKKPSDELNDKYNNPIRAGYTIDAFVGSMELSKIYFLISNAQAYKSIDDLSKVAKPLLETIKSSVSSLDIVLYDNKINVENIRNVVLPRRAHQIVHVDIEGEVYDYSTHKSFSPQKELSASELFKTKESSVFLVHPIFFETTHYGYAVFKEKVFDHALNTLYLKLIANVYSRAYDYSAAITENTKLSAKYKEAKSERLVFSKQSKTDELTKLLNRRGVLDIGQKNIDLSVQTGTFGSVFFGDMNGLKSINDTYGHKWGDKAIIAQAQILKKTFRNSDVLGRLGGDEFVIVAPGASSDRVEFFRKKLADNAKKIKEEMELPFDITISLGVASITQEENNISDLISKADASQYIEKRNFHKNN